MHNRNDCSVCLIAASFFVLTFGTFSLQNYNTKLQWFIGLSALLLVAFSTIFGIRHLPEVTEGAAETSSVSSGVQVPFLIQSLCLGCGTAVLVGTLTTSSLVSRAAIAPIFATTNSE
jgi:hypothetical protein